MAILHCPSPGMRIQAWAFPRGPRDVLLGDRLHGLGLGVGPEPSKMAPTAAPTTEIGGRSRAIYQPSRSLLSPDHHSLGCRRKQGGGEFYPSCFFGYSKTGADIEANLRFLTVWVGWPNGLTRAVVWVRVQSPLRHATLHTTGVTVTGVSVTIVYEWDWRETEYPSMWTKND